MKAIFLVLSILLLISTISATSYSDCSVYGNCKENKTSFGNYTYNINNSYFTTVINWTNNITNNITNNFNPQGVNLTQMTNATVINLKETWLSTFIHSIIDSIFADVSKNTSSINTTYNIQMLLNSTGIYNQGSNSTFNESYTNGLYAPNTTSGIQYLINDSFVPYNGAVKNVDLGIYNFKTDGNITMNGSINLGTEGTSDGRSIRNLMYFSGGQYGNATGDGFRIDYNYNLDLANDDWLLFMKTDSNDAYPDGGIGFGFINGSGYNETTFRIYGDERKIVSTLNLSAPFFCHGALCYNLSEFNITAGINYTLETFNAYNNTWDNSWVNVFAYNHTLAVFNTWGQLFYNMTTPAIDYLINTYNTTWSSTYNSTYENYVHNVSLNYSDIVFTNWNSTWDNNWLTAMLSANVTSVNTTENIGVLYNATSSIIANDSFNQNSLIFNDSIQNNAPWNISGTNVYLNNPAGKVGIGTASPTRQLSVYNSGTAVIQATTGATAVTGITLQSDASTQYLWGYEDKPLLIGTNGVTKMTILSGGNVGIGTTNPTQKLEVNGNIFANGGSFNLNGTIAGTGYTFYNTSNFLRWLIRPETTEGGSDSGYNINFVARHDDGSVYQNVMTLQRTGNVGIGTTSPTFKLDINGNARATIYYFKSPNNPYLAYNVTRDSFTFGDGSASYLSINVTDSNVGIGTTSPSAKLDILDTTYLPLRITDDLTTDWLIQKRRSDNTQLIGLYEPAMGYLSMMTTNLSRLTIDNTGKVGIGTTTPTKQLQVHGANLAAGQNLFQLSTALEGGVSWPTVAEFALRNQGDTTESYLDIKLKHVQNVTVSSDMTAMTITSLGNVGIGTVTPRHALEVVGNVSLGSAGNNASGANAVAMGYNTTASGGNSTAMGAETIASGQYSTAMGWKTNSSGIKSTAMGQKTTSSSDTSTAMGFSTIASSSVSTAMGWGTNSSGFVSTSMGRYTSATDDYSTAMGFYTIAEGDYSTAMGNYTNASGVGSTAIGNSINVSGINSVGIGIGTTGYSVTGNNVIAIMGGQVGIGIGTPDYQLEIAGARTALKGLNVSGIMLVGARDVNITGELWINAVNNTAPDYVFESNYTIKSLSEIENFTKQYKHLEGVQSAEEIKTSGINSVDFSFKLLEKVEEIFLHLFRLDKRIKVLQEENIEQNNTISSLQNKLNEICKLNNLLGC